MSYWSRPSFWALFLFGWLVTSLFVGLLAGCAGVYTSLYRRLDIPAWAIIAAVSLLSFVSGWEFARQRIDRPNTRGFPIEPKADNDHWED